MITNNQNRCALQVWSKAKTEIQENMDINPTLELLLHHNNNVAYNFRSKIQSYSK